MDSHTHRGRLADLVLGQEREASWGGPPIPGPHGGRGGLSRGHRALGLPLDGTQVWGRLVPDIRRQVSRTQDYEGDPGGRDVSAVMWP